MNHRSLTVSVLALGLCSAAACNETESPAEERAEARQELAKALEEHRDAVREADQENPADREKKVTQANAELAVADADESDRKEIDADDERDETPAKRAAHDKDAVEDRFEAYNDETKEQFQTRAQARIAALETEIRSMEGDGLDSKASEEVAEARTSLVEARKDLDEVMNGSKDKVDDGKTGVAVAINKARRKVGRVKDDMREKK